MKKRDINTDFIRVMACILVIFCHVNSVLLTSVDKSKILWTILTGDGVAFFFMLMGFFLFENNSYIKVIKKTTKNILIPAFIVMFFSRLLYPWVMNQESFLRCLNLSEFDWRDLFTCLLNWTPGGYNTQHLWYIFAYFQIILLFPTLKLLCPSMKNEEENGRTFKVRIYVIVLTLFGLLLKDVQSCFTLYIPVGQYLPFFLPAVYTITGYTIYEKRDQIRSEKSIPIMFGVIAIVAEMMRFILQVKVCERDLTSNYYSYWNIGLSLIFTLSVTIVIMAIPFKNGMYAKLITYTGSLTFYIYLVHYSIIQFLLSRSFDRWVYNLFKCTSDEESAFLWKELTCMRFIFVFSISFFISVIIRFISKNINFRKLKKEL